EYNERWAELEASTNPIAVVVMAHLKARVTRKDGDSRLRWKLRLVRLLYERGWKRQEVRQLFRFIDWVLALPRHLEKQFRDELKQIDTETRMRYVTSIERLGREEGVQEGILLGEATLLKRQLVHRFRDLPEWAERRLQEASREELEGLALRVVDAERLEDVFVAE
ncbi:MAG: DUF4351 domain-containing protein, partial [bacterium]|nr:DUF4351 domain-containing protein [bacterium]